MFIDLGLLILRLVLGFLFIGHGAQKLFGWFGGPGMKGVTGWLGSMGMRPAWFWALMAGLSEFGGGVLLVLGFLSPLGSLGIIAAMLVAINKAHLSKGLWNSNGGYEFPLMNIAAALAIGLAGAGAYSLDAMIGFALPEPVALTVGIVLVIVGLVTSVATEAPKPAQTAPRAS
ncbi:MAG TPA: DoxX family protein [Anaerolineae bacterium]